MTGENDEYNYSKVAHFYPPFYDISCSAKNYKIAPALTLFSQEKVSEIHDYNIAKEARAKALAEGITIGIDRGIEKGIAQGEQNMILRLLDTLSLEQTAAVLKIPVEDIRRVVEGPRS